MRGREAGPDGCEDRVHTSMYAREAIPASQQGVLRSKKYEVRSKK